MKYFYYLVRQKHKHLWYAHKGSNKWTESLKNSHIFKAASKVDAEWHVTKVMQKYHEEPLLMEPLPVDTYGSSSD